MTAPERTRIVPLTRATLPAGVWSTAMTVRFGHRDVAGIVFTPRYFDLMQEAIESFMPSALGIDYDKLLTERRIGLGYVQAACEFVTPSRMGEVLDIAILVERIGRASYALVLPILKGDAEVARGRLVTAPTALDQHRSCPIPPDLGAALEGYRVRCAGWLPST